MNDYVLLVCLFESLSYPGPLLLLVVASSGAVDGGGLDPPRKLKFRIRWNVEAEVVSERALNVGEGGERSGSSNSGTGVFQ